MTLSASHKALLDMRDVGLGWRYYWIEILPSGMGLYRHVQAEKRRGRWVEVPFHKRKKGK